MKFTYNGKMFRIRFQYDLQVLVPALGECRRGVICHVETLDQTPELWEPRYEGWSAVHPNDQFDKATGRKIALTRALSDQTTKQFRTAVWTAYLERGKPL